MNPPRPDDIEFALAHSRVLREPIRRIDTFGTTTFRFQLLAEKMDGGMPVVVRSGRLEANRPRILTADHLRELSFDGFGEQARRFREFLERSGEMARLLQYGLTLRKSEVTTEEVHEPLAAVEARVLAEAQRRDDPLLAVLAGVDEVWEVSLLRFALDLVAQSRETNLFDLKRKGMI